jgi:hypothetical protein
MDASVYADRSAAGHADQAGKNTERRRRAMLRAHGKTE